MPCPSSPVPKTFTKTSLETVKSLCRCDKVKDGEIFLDCDGPNVITSILIRRTQKDELRRKEGWKQRAERRKDAMLLEQKNLVSRNYKIR